MARIANAMWIMLLNVAVITPAHAQQYHSGYAIIQPADTDSDDLRQPVYLTVQGSTVYEGLQEILSGTGYRLANPAAADPNIHRLYEQPYATIKRRVGPSDLCEVLEMVAGDAWRLVVDPVNRVVSFETHEHYRTTAH